MDAAAQTPIRVAVANDYELIVRGVSGLLADDDRLEVVALHTGRVVDVGVDVVLFDNFGSGLSLPDKVAEILAGGHVGHLVLYSAWYDRQAVDLAIEAGARGFVAKSASAAELCDAIVKAHGGERVLVGVEELEVAEVVPPDDARRTWPGKEFGLTEREANVLALIVQGLENTDIAERLYISVNTVKTRIRGLYRKIGVDSRVQAALWAVKHGFDPDNCILWVE